MDDKKLYVVRFTKSTDKCPWYKAGEYWCGLNKADRQLRKARIFTSLKFANDIVKKFSDYEPEIVEVFLSVGAPLSPVNPAAAVFVSCGHTDCVHCDTNDFHCKQKAIIVSDEYYEGCDCYEDFRDAEGYTEKYYICVKTKSGELAKAVKYGKSFRYKRRLFYTSERMADDGYFKITDAKTGLLAGEYRYIAANIGRMREYEKNYRKVEEYPLAEWNNGGYELVKEAEATP